MKKSNWIKSAVVALLLIVALTVTSLPAFAVGRSSTLAKKGDTYLVTASRLNVRSGPGMGYSIEKRIKKGTKVTYQSSSSGWWYVKLPGGDTGYVDKQYLCPVNQNTTSVVYTVKSKVKVRANPRNSDKKIGTLKKGAKVTVLHLNGD